MGESSGLTKQLSLSGRLRPPWGHLRCHIVAGYHCNVSIPDELLPWHSAAAHGGLCVGLEVSLGAAGELRWEATHLQEGLAWLESREGSELRNSPGLWRDVPKSSPLPGCWAPARAPQVLGTPRCPFNHVTANTSIAPPHAQSSFPRTTQHHPGPVPPGTGSSTTAGCSAGSCRAASPAQGAVGAASAEHQPGRCLGGSRRMQRRPGRNSSGSTN